MSKQRAKSRKPQLSINAGAPRKPQAQPQAKDSEPARVAEHHRVPERPHRFLIGFLVVLIVLGGHLAAPAIADPASVPRPWSFVVSGLAAATIGLSTATLTTLVYCLVFFGDVEPASNLLKWVANYAAFGAILGTLLGLRMAGPLLADAQRVTFVGLLGIVSNTATLLTLFMIAICWVRVPVLIREMAKDSAASSSSERLPAWTRRPGTRRLQTLLLMFVGNSAGAWAGVAVWKRLQRSA